MNRKGIVLAGGKGSCLEEIAFLNGWFNKAELKELIDNLGKTHYSAYLAKIINAKV